MSSFGTEMLVQFLTDNRSRFIGFKAYFHYIPIEPNCLNWLNMTTKLLKSPDYPKIDCSWVITTMSINSMIVIYFDTFEVNCI